MVVCGAAASRAGLRPVPNGRSDSDCHGVEHPYGYRHADQDSDDAPNQYPYGYRYADLHHDPYTH